MNSKSEEVSRPCWFVGAMWGNDDQAPRFIQGSIWENGHQNSYLDEVKSIQVGDRIAIKSTFTRKNDLPFDNRGHVVSVMRIKAIGTVKVNPGDGRNLKVDWEPVDPWREWYFYTYMRMVWRVLPGYWKNDSLIAFTFEKKNQDIDRFRNDPLRRDRFGDVADSERQFIWTRFYEAVADKIFTYRNRRGELVSGIHTIASEVDGLSSPQDQFSDGSKGPLKDICPFTAMGIFNRQNTDANRKAIAKGLANLLGVTEPVPDSFEGIPILNNQGSWFFGFEKNRKPDDIDALWEAFAQAIVFKELDDADARSAFIAAYDNAMHRGGVGWKLTMGFYWIRPWNFPTLDDRSRRYISENLNIQIGKNGPKSRCSANDYLAVLDTLELGFQEDEFPVHSFPRLSLAAFSSNNSGTSAQSKAVDSDAQDDEEDAVHRVDFPKDSSGRRTLNTILYGPPGTGKTYKTFKRCVKICDGKVVENEEEARDRYQKLLKEGRIEFVTFHQSYSYEEFVEGLRPEPLQGGGFELKPKDGVLKRIAKRARNNHPEQFVLVIDEINRANVSKVLGELVTLLEEDKREGEKNQISLRLPYSGDSDSSEPFTLPKNLHILGTMNTADRSIALLDTALRRRFEFEEIPPDPTKLSKIDDIDLEGVLKAINQRLEWFTDRDHLIGHAWLMKAKTKKQVDQIMRNKIIPLIAEYFYDDWKKVQSVLGGGDGFLKEEKISPPPGYENDIENERVSWSIRHDKDSFSVEAYTRLIEGKLTKQNNE